MTSAPPTYQVLADELAKEIVAVEPGERLPSEVELAERYSVSRLTARAAVQELERRYLVRRAKGSGTYVAHRVDYVISPRFTSWTEMVHRAGATTTRPIVSSKVIRASDELRVEPARCAPGSVRVRASDHSHRPVGTGTRHGEDPL